MITNPILHVLWSKAVGTPDYVKDEWKQLEATGDSAVFGVLWRKAQARADYVDDEWVELVQSLGIATAPRQDEFMAGTTFLHDGTEHMVSWFSSGRIVVRRIEGSQATETDDPAARAAAVRALGGVQTMARCVREIMSGRKHTA